MRGKDLMDSVSTVMAVVILVVIAALIVGTLLNNSVFKILVRFQVPLVLLLLT